MNKTVGLDKAGMEAAVDFLHASSQYAIISRVFLSLVQWGLECVHILI